MSRSRATLLLLALSIGCSDDRIGLGKGSPDDARLFADVYTWDCEIRDEDGNVEEIYDGVYSYNISMEYAPDGLADRTVPESGCETGLDLFPADAGDNAVDLPDAGPPEWSNSDLRGSLAKVQTGFYYSDVYDRYQGCTPAEELLGEGTSVTDAGVFSGARTPAPGSIADVSIGGDVDETSGVTFGQDITVSWTSTDWEESWIQIRRETEGRLLESVTCATGGAESFSVDADVWGYLSGAIEAEVTDLYVVVQNRDTIEAEDGQKIEVVTRAMHTAVVH